MFLTTLNEWIIENILLISFVLFLAIFILNFTVKKATRKYSPGKELLKCESPIEELLMNALIEKGYKVYTQERCGIYRIDLSIHNYKRKIAIECDGEAYHSSKKQLMHDRKKDKYLRRNKWIVLRFSGSEIYRDRDMCIQTIERNFMTKKDRKKLIHPSK